MRTRSEECLLPTTHDRPPAFGEEQLRAAIRRWAGLRAEGRRVEGVDQAPGCVYGLLTREALQDLAQELEQMRDELTWIRRLIVGAVAAALVGTIIKWVGWV